MSVVRRASGAAPQLIQIGIRSRVLVFTILAAVVCVQSKTPAGYIVNIPAGKAYKLMYQPQQWTRARSECTQNGASLAVPKSQDEFKFLQKLIRNMYYPQGTRWHMLLIWLGISSLDDLTSWRTIDGEDINDTGFNTWASRDGGSSYDLQEPHCAGMDARNPGLRYYWCHLRQPYICEIQVMSHGAPNHNNVNEDVEHFLHERYIFQ